MGTPISRPDCERYVVDYDWLWQRQDPTAAATLRVSVSHATPQVAAQALCRLLESLPSDAGGVRGSGGWAVYPVAGNPCALDLVSGGQDVADGIQAGADAVFDALAPVDGIGLTWHQVTTEAVPSSIPGPHPCLPDERLPEA